MIKGERALCQAGWEGRWGWQRQGSGVTVAKPWSSACLLAPGGRRCMWQPTLPCHNGLILAVTPKVTTV